VRVAVVYHAPDPEAGGYFTIQQTVVEALRTLEPETKHEFRYYAAAAEEPRDGDATWLQDGGRAQAYAGLARLRLRAQAYVGLASSVARDFGVTRGVSGLVRPSRLDRQLDADGADLVWFISNHVEECDRPYIFTLWDLAHREAPWFPEVRRGGEWERRELHYRRWLPRATRVIVPNAAGADQIERHGFGSRYLLYPAALWPHKNHRAAIAAVRELADRGAPFELVCVGSDRDGQAEHLRGLAAGLGVAAHVHFLGFVSIEELVALYQHAFALLYLSFFGPENLPPLEAFALGCPVVYSDVPGAAEQLGDAALLVPPTDVARIADAVQSLEDAALRERYVEAGRARSAQLTPKAYVRGVIDFLDEFQMVRGCWP
jgi:glycosyltransferase involved in cell wall biosynthesis